MMSLSYFKAAGNSREISGTSRKKTMHFISSRLHLLTLFFSFTVRWVQRYGAVSPIQSFFAQVAACDTLGVDKRYPISVLILLFAILVLNTANVCRGYTSTSVFPCYFIFCFDLIWASISHFFSCLLKNPCELYCE